MGSEKMDYPITDQPTSGFGMPKQGGNLEGLERLAQLRELTVKQRHPGCLELMECWEYQNKYDVADENGEQTFFLKEESSCLMRSCCANARELEVSMQGVVHQILSPISNSESTNFFNEYSLG